MNRALRCIRRGSPTPAWRGAVTLICLLGASCGGRTGFATDDEPELGLLPAGDVVGGGSPASSGGTGGIAGGPHSATGGSGAASVAGASATSGSGGASGAATAQGGSAGAGPADGSCGLGLQHGAPWPMRGRCPSHTARSPFVGAASGATKWSYKTGLTVSSPAVDATGTVYLGGSDEHFLYAVSSVGALKWKLATGGAVSSSPAIGSDGAIYVGCDDHELYAVTPMEP